MEDSNKDESCVCDGWMYGPGFLDEDPGTMEDWLALAPANVEEDERNEVEELTDGEEKRELPVKRCRREKERAAKEQHARMTRAAGRKAVKGLHAFAHAKGAGILTKAQWALVHRLEWAYGRGEEAVVVFGRSLKVQDLEETVSKLYKVARGKFSRPRSCENTGFGEIVPAEA